jgi:hypothetical protein
MQYVYESDQDQTTRTAMSATESFIREGQEMSLVQPAF